MNKQYYRLIEHNSDDQMNFNAYHDTRKFLVVGNVYLADVEEHSFHTRLWIKHTDGSKYDFNSVVFEPVNVEARTP